MEGMLYPYLYRGSLAEARRRNQIDLWQESLRENIRCKDAIEEAIRRDFDGMHLKGDCVRRIIEQYGFRRTAWVLSNTLQQKEWDGRFSPQNKEWARKTFIPGEGRCTEYLVESHPAVLNGFVSQFREKLQALKLIGPEHCETDSFSSLDYTGKVLVLSSDALREKFWSPENQLWLALDGFGCSPGAIGRSVRCICLWDGETTRWNRSEFAGVLKEEYLPDWAKERICVHSYFGMADNGDVVHPQKFLVLGAEHPVPVASAVPVVGGDPPLPLMGMAALRPSPQ